MSANGNLSYRAIRWCAGLVLTFALWTLWLALILALAFQLFIVSQNELTLPEFAWRRIERQITEAGLRATFDGSSVDPTGRILLHQARLFAAGLTDPVITARAVFVELNPWMLAVGRFEPREIRLSGATISVPGRLSPSATPEALVHDLEFTVRPGSRRVDVIELGARVAGITVSARGTVPLPRARGRFDPRDVARMLERHLAEICTQALAWQTRLQALQEPALHLEFAPSDSGAPMADIALFARALEFQSPAIQAGGLRLSTRAILLDQVTISRVDFSAESIRTTAGGGVSARHVRGVAYGRIQDGSFRFEPRQLELAADAVAAAGFSADAVSAAAWPRPWPRVDASVAAILGGEPVVLEAEADFAARQATLRAHGRIDPGLLGPLGERLKVDVRRYFDFDAFELVEGEARLGPEWAFEGFTARARLEGIDAYGVSMDRGHALVTFDGRHFHAPEAFATIGENFARGSFRQDLQTREFRFLLEGRLRPMAISPWFRPWWSNFFQQLEFPAAPPDASVDVGGVWRENWRTQVFVFADAPRPVIRGGAFDQVRTRLFIRPGYFDGLEVSGTTNPGAVRGTFTFIIDQADHAWRSLELNLASDVELGLARQIIGPPSHPVLAPFALANPPELRMNAIFAGPASPGGPHYRVSLKARTAGEFRFHHFPMQDVSFTAEINDQEIVLDDFAARFASGTAEGSARVWGRGDERRLGFDLNLKEASLGPFAAALEEFFAFRDGRPPAPPGRYAQEKADLRLDIAASAEGSYTNPFSFEGSGHALLHGEEIGEVPLLGTLSELLRFTTLRLTSARANFRIERTKLVFSEVALRGSSAAIDAYGDYHVDRRQLDFNARVFPFQESGNLIKSVVGAVLTPLSNVLEVKLTGSLQKPEWAFVLGPTSILRALSPDERDPERDGPPDPAATPPAPQADPSEPRSQAENRRHTAEPDGY
jgi:hypothetical protein